MFSLDIVIFLTGSFFLSSNTIILLYFVNTILFYNWNDILFDFFNTIICLFPIGVRAQFESDYYVLRFWPALIPLLLVVTSALSTVTIPARHSLFVNAVVWLAVALYYGVKVDIRSGKRSA
ncbi:hypothetical protein EG327_010446 [Venturia inaequalis]|uniref:Uncharacterized protein n=1 Tax=Venturia inaequalis TaxID=5025 RepID=A0A8H3UFW1_VENIN|nr:hypothetical protein EG327_010446 [Venturia inaequalis]